MPAPVLTTDRLILRPFTLADAPAYAAIRLHEKVTPWLLPPLAGETELATATRIIGDFQRAWLDHKVGPWAVCRKNTGELIGHCGLRYLPEFKGVEVLWTLHPHVWGNGFATEAATASLQFGFEQAALKEIFAITVPDNLASRAVMQRIGLGYRRELEWKAYIVVYYDIDRAAWQSKRQ